MEIFGWVEENGVVLSRSEIENISVERLKTCGGEFFLKSDSFTARDLYGIFPGDGKPGVIRTKSSEITIQPKVPELSLEEAILESVRLRYSRSSVVTLSGGVDSTLIAVLANLPCIAVGVEGSHDLIAAEYAAEVLGLKLSTYIITEDEVEKVLPTLLRTLQDLTPMNVEIGVTGFFVGVLAKKVGAEKILTGQAADELFGGYARYGQSSNLRFDLCKDFDLLYAQRLRDSAAVSLSNVWYSMPYMDLRVVLASQKFSDEELVSCDLRKIALRRIAEKYLPKDIAWKEKKAMQYGSGVSKVLRGVVKRSGCGSLGELILKNQSYDLK